MMLTPSFKENPWTAGGVQSLKRAKISLPARLDTEGRTRDQNLSPGVTITPRLRF